MIKLSTGQDSTLGNYLRLTEAFFGPESASAKFLKDKILESSNGADEEVIAEEGQMIYMLGNMHVNDTKKQAKEAKDDILISNIAKRAVNAFSMQFKGKKDGEAIDGWFELIKACHEKIPLRLAALCKSDAVELMNQLAQMSANYSKSTDKFSDGFIPKYAQSEESEVELINKEVASLFNPNSYAN